MRYSKRDREMAARLCSIKASHEWPAPGHVTPWWVGMDEVINACGASDTASELAWAAADAAFPDNTVGVECWAEAEALIRTGWSP